MPVLLSQRGTCLAHHRIHRKEAPLSVRPIENKDLIFTESEGREGIEQTFDLPAQGPARQPPCHLRRQWQQILRTRRGASRSRRQRHHHPRSESSAHLRKGPQGKLQERSHRLHRSLDRRKSTPWPLAASTTPTTSFPSSIRRFYKQVSDDPDCSAPAPRLPLRLSSRFLLQDLCRPLRLPVGKLTAKDIQRPHRLDVGNFTFHNWKKYDAGRLNFVEALTQSCNTWFIQVGLNSAPRTSSNGETDRLGLGKIGIPLKAEAQGKNPNDTYMLAFRSAKSSRAMSPT